MDQNDNTADHRDKPAPTTPYNGRVMVVSVVICFAVLLIIAFFQLYTRLYWGHHHRHRSAQLRRRRRQSWSHELASSAAGTSTAATGKGQGLPAAVLKALPTFQYSASPDGEAECAVCLSEFEEGETGRVLPDCKHCFHVDCIDMWFATHSSCPLCRAPVERGSEGITALPTVWSPFIRDLKLPELTSIRVEAPEEAAGVKHDCPGCSSGSTVPTVDPKI